MITVRGVTTNNMPYRPARVDAPMWIRVLVMGAVTLEWVYIGVHYL